MKRLLARIAVVAVTLTLVGGVLAYEAASRLSSEGETIGFVALFDTFGPGDVVAITRQPTFSMRDQLDRFRRVRTLWDVRRVVVARERDEAKLHIVKFWCVFLLLAVDQHIVLANFLYGEAGIQSTK